MSGCIHSASAIIPRIHPTRSSNELVAINLLGHQYIVAVAVVVVLVRYSMKYYVIYLLFLELMFLPVLSIYQ